MTKIEKLEKLKSEMRKVCPNLMDLSDGCYLKKPHSFGDWLYVVYNNYIMDYFDGTQILCSVTQFDKHFTDEMIIGKEPMLNDVLYFLRGFDCKIHSINKNGMFHDNKWNLVCHWDLSKPYLQDQDEKVINVIYDEFIKIK